MRGDVGDGGGEVGEQFCEADEEGFGLPVGEDGAGDCGDFVV